MNYFEIHITEHCNLNCKSCDNFSPIANKEYLSEEIFKNDMKRMSELFSNNITEIRLLGGEPLLHPNINFFLVTARKYFTNAKILLTTNAILLDKMPENFYKCCHDNNIIVEYTYYPININREKHKELANKYDFTLIPFYGIETTTKILYRIPINDKKDKDIVYNYNNCWCVKNKCISLRNGKIYPCTRIPNIYHFNKFFNKNLEVTENDYIDIYNHTAEQIDKFLTHPVPFCGYCNISNIGVYNNWTTTNKNITEWLDE